VQLLNAVLAVAIAVLVVWTSKPWEVWQFEGRFLASLLAALVLDALLVVVWAYRHALALEAGGHTVSPMKLTPLVTFSNAANNLTPAATGEVMRAWFLNKKFGVPVGRAGGVIVFERVFILGLMAMTAVIAGLLALDGDLWLILLALTGLAFYIFVLPRFLKPLTTRSSREIKGGRVRRTIVDAARQSVHLWSQPRLSVGTAIWTAFAFACQGLVFWLAASVSGLSLTAAETWALLGGATVVGVISSLPFGLGAAELTAIGIGAILGIEGSSVGSAFVLYRLFLTLPLALAGAYSYWRLTVAEPAGLD
jgi:uncharacterized protein (TIRG00374 family)